MKYSYVVAENQYLKEANKYKTKANQELLIEFNHLRTVAEQNAHLLAEYQRFVSRLQKDHPMTYNSLVK